MAGTANRKYKDTVFVALFKEKDKLIELYNAVCGARLSPEADIKIRTLENTLYGIRKNDIAFQADDEFIVMVEHQSTVNENMPIRMLLYLARVYEAIIDNKAVYRERLYKIPAPRMVVLYNGARELPEETVLRLSDAFSARPEGGMSVEAEVKVININYGAGGKALEASPTLKEYSYFVAKIRDLEGEGLQRSEAIRRGIEECVAEGVLSEFLKENGSEVHNMIFEEFDIDEALRVREEEGKQEGLREGLREGKQEVVSAIKKKVAKGLEKQEIADMLELEESYVEEVLEVLRQQPDLPVTDITRIIIEKSVKQLA